MPPIQSVAPGIAWETQSPFLDVDYKAPNTLGVSPLKHLAIKKALSDQRNLDGSHFHGIPWPIAKELWQYLTFSGNRTIHLWRILCMAYPEDFRRLAQNCESCVTAPQYSLGGYINFLKNSISTWGVSLNVWTEFARVPELVDLASVTNLVSLEVNTTTTAQPDSLQELAVLNDRILRTWSEVSTTSEAFKHLQVLRLYHQRDLSQQSLAYLSRLPSLMFCVLAKCDRLTDRAALKAAKSHGWVAANISDLQSTHCLSLAFSAPTSTGTRWCTEQQTSPSLTSDLPMITFSIGHRCTEVKDRDVLILQRVAFHDPPNSNKRDSSGLETAITSHDRVERTKRPKMRMRGKDLSGLLNGFL